MTARDQPSVVTDVREIFYAGLQLMIPLEYSARSLPADLALAGAS